jgi:hypothetical protein
MPVVFSATKNVRFVLRNPRWLKEQSEHFSKANLMIERERKRYLLYDQS